MTIEQQPMLRAAMYGRVSTHGQVESTSPDEQRRLCRERIERDGWYFVGEFVDEGVSGAKGSRPRLDVLMAECRAGNVDAVVVSKLDRFGRSNRHLENLLGELDDLGVRFLSLSESFDSTIASGRFLRTILGGAAEFERANIKERTMSGLAATAKGGFWVGGPPPYGYTVVEAGKHKRLAILDEEAEMLRTAVALIVDERITTKETADRLNALGLKPRRASRWTYHNLRRTLLDACLSGEWTYSRPRGRKKKPKGIPPLPVAVPAIMSRERHEQLLAVLRSTSNIRRKSNFYLLVGGRLMSACGARYQGYPRPTGRRQYRCYAHRTYADDRCDCRMVDANDVETAVWRAVSDLLSNPDRLLLMAADYLGGIRAEQGKVERSQLAEMQRRVERLEEGLARAYEDRYTSGLDRPAIDRAIEQMERDLGEARARAATVAAWEADNRAAAERVIGLRELADLATRRLSDMPPQDKRRVLDLLDIRASVAAWSRCQVCRGRGKIESKPKPGGTPCPACHMSRWLPSLRIEGVVYERLLRETLAASNPATAVPSRASKGGWPFRVNDVTVT